MPKKFIKCVKKVKARMKATGYKGNPYAICRVSTGYYGTTHNIGMLHRKKKCHGRCHICKHRHYCLAKKVRKALSG